MVALIVYRQDLLKICNDFLQPPRQVLALSNLCHQELADSVYLRKYSSPESS